MTTLKELQSSVAEIDETVHTAVARVLHQSQLCVRVTEKAQLNKTRVTSRLQFARRLVEHSEVGCKKEIEHCPAVRHGGGSTTLWNVSPQQDLEGL